MSRVVAVIAEMEQGRVTEPTLECLAEAREVADALSAFVRAVVPGHEHGHVADLMLAGGADSVAVIEHEALGAFSSDGWLAAVEPILRDAPPALVVAPDSGRMRSLLPRLALRWRAPLLTGSLRMRVMPNKSVEITTSVQGGTLHERYLHNESDTLFLTVSPGVRGLAPSGNGQVDARTGGRPCLPGVGAGREPVSIDGLATHSAPVTRIKADLNPSQWRDRTVQLLSADPKTVDISEADFVVAGGLGVGTGEGMDLLRRLADRLGAAIGGTRVLVDRGLLPSDRQIGATGKTVAPRVYLALGISGAGQHTSGMTASENVVVVNTDLTAPMFGLADLGAVGDLHEVVPALLRALEKAND